MKTAEQIKAATETISLLQDYIELVKVQKRLKTDTAKDETGDLICEVLDKANYNVCEVL